MRRAVIVAIFLLIISTPIAIAVKGEVMFRLSNDFYTPDEGICQYKNTKDKTTQGLSVEYNGDEMSDCINQEGRIMIGMDKQGSIIGPESSIFEEFIKEKLAIPRYIGVMQSLFYDFRTARTKTVTLQQPENSKDFIIQQGAICAREAELHFQENTGGLKASSSEGKTYVRKEDGKFTECKDFFDKNAPQKNKDYEIYFGYQGWMNYGSTIATLPIAAECESYAIQIVDTISFDLSETTYTIEEMEGEPNIYYWRRTGNTGSNSKRLSVKLIENNDGLLSKFSIKYLGEGDYAGIYYKLICKNPQVDPTSTEDICESDNFNGMWRDSEEVCCYEETLGDFSPDESNFCFFNEAENKYEWITTDITDNPDCEGGVYDGLKSEPSYCCQPDWFKPKPGSQYFCDEGTIVDGLNNGRVEGEDATWLFNGEEWKTCDAGSGEFAAREYYCKPTNNDPSNTVECKCNNPYGSRCGSNEEVPHGWLCAPGEQGPYWTQEHVEGACSNTVNSKCCFPGDVDVEVDEENPNYSKGCLNGYIIGGVPSDVRVDKK